MSILYLKCLVFQPNDNFLFHSEKLKFHLLQNKEAADLKRPWNYWQFKLTNEFWASEWMIMYNTCCHSSTVNTKFGGKIFELKQLLEANTG